MKNYSLFYSYKNIGDVLIIIFNNELKATHDEKRGNVTVIYHDDEIIGYNIFNIKEIIKIRSEGKIFLPSSALISVINSILKNAKLPVLDEQIDSGYYVAVVKTINDKNIIVSLSNEELIAKKVDGVAINDKVVVARKGTTLADGSVVKEEGHICTNVELGIKEEEKILVLDEDVEIGKDFFSMEEK